MQLGILLDIAAMFVLMWTVRHFGSGVTSWDLVPALFIGGVGMGLVAATLVDFSLSDVPIGDAGSASGVFNTVRQLGGALGVAVSGVIYFGLLGHRDVVDSLSRALWYQHGPS